MTSKYVSILNYWNSQLFFKCKSTAMNHSPSEAVLSLLQLMYNHSAHNLVWFIHEGDCFIRVSKDEETDERGRVLLLYSSV